MGHNVAGIVLGVLIIAVIVALVVFVVGAVVSVLRAPLTGGMKVVWIVLVCVAPFIGSLLWYLVGRSHARTAS